MLKKESAIVRVKGTVNGKGTEVKGSQKQQEP
jgi:hypothetical protein